VTRKQELGKGGIPYRLDGDPTYPQVPGLSTLTEPS